MVLAHTAGTVKKETSCVRCAKCIEACPLFLEPTTLVRLAKRGFWEQAEK